MTDTHKPRLGEEIAKEVSDALLKQTDAVDEAAMSPILPEVEKTKDSVEIATKLLSEERVLIDMQEAQLTNSGKRDLIERVETDEPHKVVPLNALTFQQVMGTEPFYAPKQGDDKEAIDAIFAFAPVRPSRFPDVLYERITGLKIDDKKESSSGMITRMQEPLERMRLFLGNMAELMKSEEDRDPRDWTGRLQVVPKKEGELANIPSKEWPRGHILTSRSPKYRPGVADDDSFEGGTKKHYALVGGLDKLIRSHLHAKNFYASKNTIADPKERSELSTLAQLKDTIEEIIQEIQKWKGKTPEEQEALKKTISSLRAHVVNCTNQYKVEVDRLLGAASNMKDKRGQINPGAKAAQIVKALNQDLERFRDAIDIEHTVNRDYESLRALGEELDNILINVDAIIEDITDSEYFNLQEFTSDPSVAEEAIETALEHNEIIERSGIIKKLQAMVEDDGCPAPYPQVAEAIFTNLQAYMRINERIGTITEDELNKELGNSNLEKLHREACKLVLEIELVGRYVAVNDSLNEVLSEILQRPFNMDPKYTYDQINGAKRVLDPRIDSEDHDFQTKGGPRRIVTHDLNYKPTLNYLDDLKRTVQKWAEARIFLREDRKDLIIRYKAGHLDMSRDDLDIKLEKMEEMMRNIDKRFLNDLREQGREFDLAKIAQSMVIPPENTAATILARYGLYRKDGEVTAAGT